MTSYQGLMFLRGIGDYWFNKNKLTIRDRLSAKAPDPIMNLIKKLNLKPEMALDLGCSNGWRMKLLQDQYGSEVFGIDPSPQAIQDGINSGIDPISLRIGTGDNIPTKDNSFDLIIMGQVMYFVDINDWLRIVSETTRVLKDGGYIILRDYITATAVKTNYTKTLELTNGQVMPTVYAFYYDWPSLWLSHQGYSLHDDYITHNDGSITCALHKDFSKYLAAIPTAPPADEIAP